MTSRPHADGALVAEVRQALLSHADPERAPGAQAYMKSAMPFHGVPTPDRRRLCRPIFDAQPLESFEAWRDTVLALWDAATHREERYAAIDLVHHRPYREHRTSREALALCERLIVEGAWWDYVDAVATGALGGLLEAEPAWLSPQMRAWARAEDMWQRRASIICQVGFKERTDLDLLYDCIAPNLDDREFFIRKAIGWALRDYAWTDPDEVVRYVEANAARLSPLSKREALKNVLKAGRIAAIP